MKKDWEDILMEVFGIILLLILSALSVLLIVAIGVAIRKVSDGSFDLNSGFCKEITVNEE